jgi:MarR family transcriptional regulator for hemolysin
MIADNALQTAFTSQLLQAGRQWRQLFHEAVATYGISTAGAAALLLIGRLGGGVHQITVAEYAGVESPSLVRPLDQLCAAGIVRREVDPSDRRANALWLTDTGAALAKKIEVDLARLRNSLFEGVSKRDFEGALQVLDALARAAQSAPLPANTASDIRQHA